MRTRQFSQSSHHDELRWQKGSGWHIPARGNIMACGLALDPARRVLCTDTRVIRIECVCPECVKRARDGKVGK